MKRVTLSPVALALALGFSLIAAATCEDRIINGGFEEPPGCIFMPLAVGNEWEYRVTVEAKGSPTRTYNVRYEITSPKTNYKGRPVAYVIEVTEDGTPQPDVIASVQEGAAFLDRGYWAVLIWDEIASGMWTQTGLVVDFPLQCIGRERSAVPAGEFYCVVLYLENASELKPESWREYYAEDVGLVEYVNYYKEYDTSVPPQLVDWRSVEYELTDYSIKYEIRVASPLGRMKALFK